MKIFKGNESSWSSKVNFVDNNDVFVGYDTGQCCCEDAGWFIALEKTRYEYDLEAPNHGQELANYVFDKEYFEYGDGYFDSGAIVVFKLTANNKPDLYLHLYNVHNGYYSHGFELKHGENLIKEGYL